MSMLRPIDRLLLRDLGASQPIALVERLKAVGLSEELTLEAIAEVCGAFFIPGAWFANGQHMVCITYENRRLGVIGAVVRPNGPMSIVYDQGATSSYPCETTRDLMLLLCRYFVRDETNSEACVWALQTF